MDELRDQTKGKHVEMVEIKAQKISQHEGWRSLQGGEISAPTG